MSSSGCPAACRATIRARVRLPDPVLFACPLALYAIGLDALRTTTKAVAGVPLVYRQLAWGVVAATTGAVAAAIPPSWYRRTAVVGWCVTVILLLAVLTQPPTNGARSWFRLGPLSLQPAELAKLTATLATAAILAHRRKTLKHWLGAAAFCLIPAGLIVAQPDIGNASLFIPIWIAAVLASRPRRSVALAHLLVVAVCAALLLPTLTAEQRARLASFLHQSDYATRPDAEGYQLHQAKRAIMLAGLWGSAQARETHIPMAYNDFIFSLTMAHRGLLGGTAILVLYALLIGRLTWLAESCSHRFAALYLVGTAAWLGAQATANLAMTVGLAPITGITLPFVSYGGSSLVVSCTALTIAWRLKPRARPPAFAFD